MAVRIGNREIEGVIFDMDETLYPPEIHDLIFEQVQITLARSILAAQGYTSPQSEQIEETRLEYVNACREHGSWTQMFIDRKGTRESFISTVAHADRGAYLPEYPELKTYLQQLGSRAKVALFTSAATWATEGACNAMFGSNWQKLFDVILCCDTPGVTVEKPNPKAFELIAQMLALPPKGLAMVGDSVGSDIRPAAAVGMLTILVGKPGNADIKITSIMDLPSVIN